MKKRRVKKSVIKKFIILVLLVILGIGTKITIDTIKYHKTDEYKLKKIGYNIEEIKKIEQETEDNKNYILNNEYNKDIIDIMNEKYYLSKNLEKYINYKKENENKKLKEIISIINTNRDSKFYENTKDTKVELNELMLVNKYNKLDKTYKPEKIITIPIAYAYSGVEASEQGLEYYKEMHNAAKKEGINLVISSAYRSYDEQQETYDEYEKIKGDKIDTYAARPGHSEHQTGLAFDILTLGVKTTEFDTTKEFNWLQENSYKYGFILRYPKGKESITGFDYESWHYRYVGKEAAKKIHDEGITFDEYYAYYVEK
jgi:D-alanyl-D-alanine carboxypeptidase